MKGTIVAQITQIAETQKIGENNFRVREFLLKTVEEYPNFYKAQVTGEKTDILEDFKPGDVVKMKCNLKGREYQNKELQYDVFMSLNVWTIEHNH
ncbi:hypothetical protein Danklef1_37 [Polaribacter phage Danklef_1]|uniref:DUF3127 domain-containing protein n=1 Tax=Polaribacter phage Danklef_1 TaxID=2745646 RepID=A0A8E5E9J0_9CAUD|nr:hypothetical protein M1M23_gp37 [Polaribacter phage Danklef_1]QQV90595.1 hypothetical protein Danklef2_38 [Polaribacter phage Danklef_2]QQV90672.1 hypothetical protein Danklef3_39 [Polaribacter phage Danklef_3]QQV90748.1 hypothetical protein Danklef4_38 [Polaribacter phage Danklef_4]QQV90826.1 hypothetical protein Danklef5_39 [Polaribacter phage Danklef_5]QQV90518.1 hypothetical protein Danklef1_37 [Polaribacter phage Danklef_1]